MTKKDRMSRNITFTWCKNMYECLGYLSVLDIISWKKFGAPYGNRTHDLLDTGSNALPLSYEKLVVS